MTRHAKRLGACSWSLKANGPKELAQRVRQVGVANVQLALDPLRTGAWSVDETVAACASAGLSIRSGMMGMQGEDYGSLDSIKATGGVRPTEHWNANLAAARANAKLAARLGLRLVTFHAGFLPHEASDPERKVLIERLRALVDVFASEGAVVGFETGQESARTLLDVLAELDRPTAGVNFDPANMLLYDMGDPVAALKLLAPRVKQIHVKDAVRTKQRGTWGAEVCVGTGEVDWRALFAAAAESKLDVDFMIEREAGDDRIGDMRKARELVERELASGAAR
ncbi:MAG: sugar phosphate isomerase/epimerase [Planctomycetes bacterium]|nr:sugar phosphate isomerase/epimerase [Planctomycetota bacterium]